MTNDLISRSALLELYADTEDIHFAVYNVPIPVVRQNILDAPAVDAVEVVRCRDCVRYEFGFCMRSILYSKDPNGFCESGDRRGDE